MEQKRNGQTLANENCIYNSLINAKMCGML